MFGGFKIQGRTAEAAMKILEDALAIEDAGCFMLEFEAVLAKIARLISRAADHPYHQASVPALARMDKFCFATTCSVYSRTFKPKFTKRFAKLTVVAVAGIKQYVKEVKEGSLPDDDHSYTVNEAEYERFARLVEKRRQI